MTDQQIRDEALTLFLTAFDTTSNALTWTWYLLSQNPEAEIELHQELARVLNGRNPKAEDIPKLKYTRMVFGESIRIFPPSYVLAREALEDFTIDKYIVPRGSLVLMSPYLIHHDSRFRSNPEVFNPHAWGKHSKSIDSKYEYFPFGAGPRACIGQSYAWMEGILMLATIAQSWRIRLVPNHPVELLQVINLRPKYGMMMELQRRN
jgi:cytochrome P450